MANIIYSKMAINDMNEIGDYISQQHKSPKAALKTIEKIQDAINKLTVFPHIGTPVSAIIAAETDYRFIGCVSYLAFYRVKDNDIFIDRIIHGRRDFVGILFGENI